MILLPGSPTATWGQVVATQIHHAEGRLRMPFLGAVLCVLCSFSSPVFALPELTMASSGEFVCHLPCAAYRAAVERNIDDWVKFGWGRLSAEEGREILAAIDTDPNNHCGAVGMKNVPIDQRGCAEGDYLWEAVPTGYQLTGDGLCGDCPIYLGARWCESTNRERPEPGDRFIDHLPLPTSKPIQYSMTGGAKFWNAPNGKKYFISNERSGPSAPVAQRFWDAFLVDRLTPQERQTYDQSRARSQRSYDEALRVWGDNFAQVTNFGVRCCEDRDGDGMPACSTKNGHTVVSASEPSRIASGEFVGPDCDDSSRAITPAKAGPTVRSLKVNDEWATQYKQKWDASATKRVLTVITPADLLIDPGMCWIAYGSPPLSISLLSRSSGESLPIEHTGFTFSPETSVPQSGNGGISLDQFPDRSPPINWKTTFGTTTDTISPWFKSDEDLEKAITMVAAKRELPHIKLQFDYGKAFSSTKIAGVSNCFRLAGGSGESIAFRRGTSLKTNLGDVARNFLLPYTSTEPNAFTKNKSALFFLSPFSAYKDRLEVIFDLTKVSDTVLQRFNDKFRDLDLPSRNSTCNSSHAVLLHDQPGIYYAFALPGRNAFIAPHRFDGLAPSPPGAPYDWLDTSVTVTHELGHALGTLDDEYVQKNLMTPKAPSYPCNCSVNPTTDFSNNGRMYAEQPVPQGCGNHADWFRPSDVSYMNNPLEEPRSRAFNTVSCGIIISRMVGGNPKKYFPYCESLVKK